MPAIVTAEIGIQFHARMNRHRGSALGRLTSFAAILARACFAPPQTTVAAADVDVDLELVLTVDVSRSRDYNEQQLQRAGYVSAFKHPEVIKAITSGAIGRIAVIYMEWSGPLYQRVLVPWTFIGSECPSSDYLRQRAGLHTGLQPPVGVAGGKIEVPDSAKGRIRRPHAG